MALLQGARELRSFWKLDDGTLLLLEAKAHDSTAPIISLTYEFHQDPMRRPNPVIRGQPSFFERTSSASSLGLDLSCPAKYSPELGAAPAHSIGEWFCSRSGPVRL